MNAYAAVKFFDRCDCSVNEIAEFLSLHEWEVRQVLREHASEAARAKLRGVRRTPDYHGEKVA